MAAEIKGKKVLKQLNYLRKLWKVIQRTPKTTDNVCRNSMETKYLDYRFLSVKITASWVRIWFAGIHLWIQQPKHLQCTRSVCNQKQVMMAQVRFLGYITLSGILSTIFFLSRLTNSRVPPKKTKMSWCKIYRTKIHKKCMEGAKLNFYANLMC